MLIKCFALWQPWASLVIHGFKKIETRPGYNGHRGITGIHATLDNSQFKKQNEEIFYSDPFYKLLSSVGYKRFEDLPRGGVLGTVQVTEWRKIVVRDPIHPKVEMNAPIDHQEKSFGNYTAGRFGITMIDPHKFEKIFPASGKQNLLFDIDIPKELLNL